MTLILLPNLLAPADQCRPSILPAILPEVVEQLDGVIGESEKGARAFLKLFRLKGGRPLQQMPVATLNEHTAPQELQALLLPMKRGETWGFLSDAGLPCLADPGASLVALARQSGLSVFAYPGPSSIIQALLLSGFAAQRFSFEGYLPKEAAARLRRLLELQERSRQEGSTQIFIETPYRSDKLFAELVTSLAPKTELAYATALTTPLERVERRGVLAWREQPLPKLANEPTVFLFRG